MSISSLNNPQNSEMKFVKIWSCDVENHHMLHFELFHYSCYNIIIKYGKCIISNLKTNSFFEKKNIRFVNVEIDPWLQ